MDCLLEGLVADCLPDPSPFSADELMPIPAIFFRDRQACHEPLNGRDNAIPERFDDEQRKSCQVDRKDECVIQDANEKRKHGPSKMLRRRGRDHQREDDRVLDAGAESAFWRGRFD